MHKRFQIIKPFLSDKIVEAATLKKGAKQCYKEIKASRVISSDFAIKDIDSKEIFRYKINKIQMGGAEEPKVVPTIKAEPDEEAPKLDIAPPTSTDHDVAKLAIMVADLMKKVTDLEKQVERQELHGLHTQQQITATNVYDANVERLKTLRAVQDAEKCDDSCSIM
jgi:hypothetical protein